MLYSLDQFWKQHLERLSLLRDAVVWRGFGQKDPLTEYKREAFDYFLNQQSVLHFLVLYDLLRAKII